MALMPPMDFARRVQKALGIDESKKLRSIDIHLAVDEIVTTTIVYEEFTDEGDLKAVTKVLELAEWEDKDG